MFLLKEYEDHVVIGRVVHPFDVVLAFSADRADCFSNRVVDLFAPSPCGHHCWSGFCLFESNPFSPGAFIKH